MKERLFRVAKWAMYPAFYVACLALFGYLTFPFDLLRDRAIAEASRVNPGIRLEIGKISSYWFSGVELGNVKVVFAPEQPAAGGFSYPSAGADFGAGAPVTAPAKEGVIAIDEAHLRVRILPLLIGRVRLDFWASGMGGEVRGTVPLAGSNHDVDAEITQIDLNKVEPLANKLGVPVKGIANGKLALTLTEGKISKADGTVDLTIADVVVSDGKTKIAGLLELPAARIGTLTLTAEATAGVFKITKLASQGADVELIGDGRITASATKDPLNDSVADIYLRFKFTDAYRTKSETTKTLLGDPTSSLPGLIEMQVPKMKKAKRADGFFGWHIHGALKSPKFDPSTVDVAPPASAADPTAKGGKFKKSSGVNFPFGASTAGKGDGASPPPPSPPPPMNPGMPTPTPINRPQEDPIRIAPPEAAPPAPAPVEAPPPAPVTPPPAPERQAAPEALQPAPAPEQPAEAPR